MNSYNVFYLGEWLCVIDADSEAEAKTNAIFKAQGANISLKLEYLTAKPLTLSLFA